MAALTHVAATAARSPVGKVRISRVAVERYVDAVKPALDFRAGAAELTRFVEQCAEMTERPSWLLGDLDEERTRTGDRVSWLRIGSDIFLPIVHPAGETGIAVTCIARGHLSPAARESRARARRARMALRAARRQGQSRSGEAGRQRRLARILAQ